MDTTHNADIEFLARKGAFSGYQISSLLVPPAYVAYTLARHGRGAFSINALLRSTWIGGFAGSVGGAAFAFSRYNFSNAEQVREKRVRVAYDTGRIRAEDHATIGAVLFAVLTPALLWNRARIANLVLGGAGLGTGVGTLAHWTRTITGDPPVKVVPV